MAEAATTLRPDVASGALSRLSDAIGELAAVDLDPLADDQVRDHLKGVQVAIDRLTALRSRAAGLLEARAVRQAGVGRESRAVRDHRQQLADDLNLRPSQAKQTSETGRRLQALPDVQHAFEDGQLSEDHARVITDTLQDMIGPARDEAAATLVDAARDTDPTTLGRTARKLLADHDSQAAGQAEARRHRRRYARATQTPDGMVAISAQLSGIDGEVAMTAIHAFRTPDTPDDIPRTPEQATADGLVAALRAALDHGQAATQHGERPHINVVVDADTLRAGDGTAQLGWTGPVPFSEIARILDAAQVCRIVRDADSIPVEVSERVRTVPRGLWRALMVRDGGCRWPGCPAPPAWCDAAHTDIPWHRDGRLTVDTSAMFCRRHHRRVDQPGWRISVDGLTVHIHPPGGRPPLTSTADPPARRNAPQPRGGSPPSDRPGGLAGSTAGDRFEASTEAAPRDGPSP